MSLATKLISNDPFGFSLAFGHLSEFYPFIFAFDPSLCVGVDNALIKGRLRTQGRYVPLCVEFVMSGCWRLLALVEFED